MNSHTIFLGKLLGLYSLALSSAMLLHPQATVNIMESITQNPPLLFIAGLIGMTAGLAIVLSHNVWSGGALTILVTLFGWAALIKGLFLLVLSPEAEFRFFVVGLRYEFHPDVYAAVLFLLGAYLSYEGFTAHRADTLRSRV